MSQGSPGFASIVIVFVLGMVMLLLGISLLQTGYYESLMGRHASRSGQAFYLANSGVEEAVYQIGLSADYGNPGPDQFQFNFGGGRVDVQVTGSDDVRQIQAAGTYGNYLRLIVATVQNTSLKPGFANAIHAGAGGIELRNQTLVTSKDGSGGNVYSNAAVRGAKNDYTVADGSCKNSASAVDGSVWAVQAAEKIATNDSGVCVLKEIHARDLSQCFARDGLFSPNPPSADCPTLGAYTPEPAPEPIPLPNLGIPDLKAYLASSGHQFAGDDCIADGSGSPSDCTFGTLKIGNIIINGNLEKPSNVNLQVTGPVWVKGDIVFASQGSLKPAPEITQISQIIVSDGTITSESNMTFGRNVNAYLLLVSTFDPGGDPALVCDDTAIPAITISSNSESVLFYAMKGCVVVNANSQFHGALLGEGIRVENNSEVEYDPGLQTAIFGITSDGGWQITKFAEK